MGPYCVKTRGLPFEANKSNIADFLAGCKLLRGQEGIHLLVGVDGRSKGEAIVELTSAEDVEKAQAYHMKSMGHRYIEVTPLSEQEKQWELSRQPAVSKFCLSLVYLAHISTRCLKSLAPPTVHATTLFFVLLFFSSIYFLSHPFLNNANPPSSNHQVEITS